MQQFFSLLSWRLFTAQHVSGVFPPIIRSSMTAVSASGFTFVSWWQPCCVRGRAGYNRRNDTSYRQTPLAERHITTPHLIWIFVRNFIQYILSPFPPHVEESTGDRSAYSDVIDQQLIRQPVFVRYFGKCRPDIGSVSLRIMDFRKNVPFSYGGELCDIPLEFCKWLH